jgi:hypothetical protein
MGIEAEWMDGLLKAGMRRKLRENNNVQMCGG